MRRLTRSCTPSKTRVVTRLSALLTRISIPLSISLARQRPQWFMPWDNGEGMDGMVTSKGGAYIIGKG